MGDIVKRSETGEKNLLVMMDKLNGIVHHWQTDHIFNEIL